MKTKALSILVAAGLAIVLVPLAGCDRDISSVRAEKDEQGNTRIHVDGDKLDENLEQAEKGLEETGQRLKEGAREVGAALERGAQRIEAEVGPVAQEVLEDAGVTARIKAKLIADPEVAGSHIDVDTVSGRVTLNGKVASPEQKAEAEKLARHTDGVKDVVNLIQVAGQAPPAPPVPPAAQR
jgi:osmotically-inducible protein OsmY